MQVKSILSEITTQAEVINNHIIALNGLMAICLFVQFERIKKGLRINHSKYKMMQWLGNKVTLIDNKGVYHRFNNLHWEEKIDILTCIYQ